MFRIIKSYCSLCEPQKPRGCISKCCRWRWTAACSAGHWTGVSCHGIESQIQQQGEAVFTLAFFEMAFFCDGNVRWHFILFMMATPQPRTTVLENPPTDWLLSSSPIFRMQPFKYLRDSSPTQSPNEKCAACPRFVLFFLSLLKTAWIESFSFLDHVSDMVSNTLFSFPDWGYSLLRIENVH